MVAIGGIADIVQHWHEMARSRMTRSRHQRIRIWAKRQGGGGSPLPPPTRFGMRSANGAVFETVNRASAIQKSRFGVAFRATQYSFHGIPTSSRRPGRVSGWTTAHATLRSVDANHGEWPSDAAQSKGAHQ
jgi:hypothetical protein